MKQNPTASQTLTKQDLIDTLKDFRTITKQDIDASLKDFRKDFLKEIRTDIEDMLEKQENALNTRMEITFEKMELRIEDRARERHSVVLTRFDGWASELEKAQQDREFNAHQLNDHEEGIQALEKARN